MILLTTLLQFSLVLINNHLPVLMPNLEKMRSMFHVNLPIFSKKCLPGTSICIIKTIHCIFNLAAVFRYSLNLQKKIKVINSIMIKHPPVHLLKNFMTSLCFFLRSVPLKLEKYMYGRLCQFEDSLKLLHT